MGVIMTAYGRHDMTHEAVADVLREASGGSETIDLLVVDNEGGYEPIGAESVLRPGSNLGWLRGMNHGLAAARAAGHDAYVLLNNDVRLSVGFFAGLAKAERLTHAGLIAPVYDGFLHHQRVPWPHAVTKWRPHRSHWYASFIDGTCMYIPAATLDDIGVLDDRFHEHGWGGELDYSFRAWDAGRPVVITGLAFLHHIGQVTAEGEGQGNAYEPAAFALMAEGMRAKYGSGPKGWGARSGISSRTNNTHAVPVARRMIDTMKLEVQARRHPRTPA